MKFIKESIEFPSSKNNIRECIHPLREENRVSRKWGHTWFFDKDGDIKKVKAKDGTILEKEQTFTNDQGDIYHIDSFDPDTCTIFVFSEKKGTDLDFAVEDVISMVKQANPMPNKNPAQGYVTTFSKNTLNDLPGFPEDMSWYVNRYALDFKTSDHSSYYTVTGAKEDVDRFVKDFDLEVFDESKLNEEIEHSIYRVTYVVDKDANIFSAVMINARGEGDAQSIFLKKFPDTEILGIVELDDIEVKTNKKKGMSLIEDLEVDELEHEEAEEGNNPEPPVAGEESAAASLVNSLIRDEWLAIEQYNSAMVNLKELKVDEKIIEVLNHIMFDENTHVGNLQEVLALLAPATNKIEKGNEQAEQILNTEEEKPEEAE